jgi:hypothetical protein
MAEEQKFPSEIIDLPSEGKIYPKEHPCSNGKIEIKYMTAREEDILTSQNLIKKGVVVEKLLDSLIVQPGLNCDDLVLGDKNAVMVAARILAYGPEYQVEVTNPNTGNKNTVDINLADCPFRKLPKNVTENKFTVQLPLSKKEITYKLLTGMDEKKIDEELKSAKKIGSQVSPELTTRLRHTITSVDGDDTPAVINNFINGLLARDSLFLRGRIKKSTPDIILKQEIEIEGETVTVDIPMTVNFFWPSSGE